MKKNSFLLKVIVALCGSTAFILLFNYLPVWVTAAMATLISVLIFYELAYNVKLIDFLPIRIIGFTVSAEIPWIIYFGLDGIWLFVLIFLSAVFAFVSLFYNNQYGRANEIINLVFCESIFQISISLMSPILKSEHGVHYIIIAFISAWGNDALAQFGGKGFGKTKFLPSISPNKTLEGSLTGFFGNAVVISVYAVLLGRKYSDIPVAAIILCGIICGLAGEMGDLFFSYIKRTVGIKDFGKLIAGHGGVLDRFDSVVFVLPIWYVLITTIY